MPSTSQAQRAGEGLILGGSLAFCGGIATAIAVGLHDTNPSFIVPIIATAVGAGVIFTGLARYRRAPMRPLHVTLVADYRNGRLPPMTPYVPIVTSITELLTGPGFFWHPANMYHPLFEAERENFKLRKSVGAAFRFYLEQIRQHGEYLPRVSDVPFDSTRLRLSEYEVRQIHRKYQKTHAGELDWLNITEENERRYIDMINWKYED